MAPSIHQLTAPRTIQAFIVVLFSIVVSVLVLDGQQIPDLIGWSLAGIIGYYFNADKEIPLLNGNGGTKMPSPKMPAMVSHLAGHSGTVEPHRDDVPVDSRSPVSEQLLSRFGVGGSLVNENTLAFPGMLYL